MKLKNKFFLSTIIFLLALIVALPAGYKTFMQEGQPLGFLSFLEKPSIKLGLDLQGGTQLEYNIDLSKVPSDNEQNVVNGVIDIINRRVNGLGVTETNVYASDVADEKHIYVELAGIQDIERAKAVVGRTIQLEFREEGGEMSTSEKAQVRADAQIVLDEVKASPETFAETAKELAATGDRIEFNEKEVYYDDVTSFMRDAVWNAPANSIVEELQEGNDGYIFQASSQQPVLFEGFWIVKTGEKTKELRRKPANAEDFMTVALELSGETPIEKGYVSANSDSEFAAAAMLETNEVSDVIEGSNAFYIAKSTDQLQTESKMAQVAYVKFDKENIGSLERDIERREVTEQMNNQSMAEANKALEETKANPEKFVDLAREYTQNFPTFVTYEPLGAVMEDDNRDLIEDVVLAQMFTQTDNTVSDLIDTPQGKALVYVEETGSTAEGTRTALTHLLTFKYEEPVTDADLEKAKNYNTAQMEKAESFKANLATPADLKVQGPTLAEASDITYEVPGFVTEADAGAYVGAFSTEVGNISEVIDTTDAYYVVLIENKKDAGEHVGNLQVATICYGEGCAVERTKEEAEQLANNALVRVREEEKMTIEQIFFATYPEMWTPAKVDGKTLTGEHFQSAQVTYQQRSTIPEVTVTFTPEGADMFAAITERNIGKRLAIFVGDEFISAPVIQEKILGGQAQISGNFTVEEANDLSRSMNTGALPAPITLAGQQTIGATLGNLSLETSVQAMVIGLILLLSWMILYYRFNGLIAAFALIVYLVVMLALTKLFGIVLTLAGIAALILSIGMAVDANVLIFERLREELKEGRDVQPAIKTAFDRAWTSIRDSNISSLITAVILARLGTGIIRGFAIMYAMGIIVSLFSAIYVSRILLLMFARTKWGRKLISL